MGIVAFNGVTSKSLGIEVESFPTYEFPEREYEVISVPGRNGDLYIDKGSYKNVNAKYDLAIGSHEIEQPYLAEKLVSWLTSAKGYCRLEDSYYPEIYRMALYKKSGSISNIMNHGGRLSVDFECKPQKFLKIGEVKTTFSQSGTIINPTLQVAKPLLKVTGRGNGSININNKIINVNLLESATSSGSGITNIEVDTAKFMEGIGSSTDNSFVFENSDLSVDSSIDAVGITDAEVDKETFLEKTEINQENSCEFVFISSNANITSGVSDTITAVTIKDESSFLETFPTEGNYVFMYDSDYPSFNYNQTSETLRYNYIPNIPPQAIGGGGSLVGADANTYKAKFIELGKLDEAYLESTFTYNSTAKSWKNSANENVNISEYGFVVLGTPYNGEKIVSYLETHTVTVNPSTYKTRFAAMSKTEVAYLDAVYTYDSELSSWKDADNYAIELADYGINVTGTVNNGDTITGSLKVKWSNQETLYDDLFIFDGYPTSEDALVVTVIADRWVFKKNSIVVIDSGLVLEEYGVEIEGTPVNGDVIKVKVSGIWELNSETIDISDYGITYEGAAILSDTISITLGTPITIDCDTQDAYSNTINRNNDIFVQNTFPELKPGENSIIFSSGITSVEVTPRWWTL